MNSRRFFAVLSLAVLVGLAIRLIILSNAHWRVDFDEAMVGLQVMHLLRGELAIFHPGQPYLGNLESYLIAPFFALFGPTNAMLKIVPLLLSGVYIATVGILGRVAFGERTGALSALASAVAPPYMVVLGLKAWGATIESLVLGNLILLITLAILRENRLSRWIWLGFISGVAYFISWLFVFYAVPAGILLLWRFRQKALRPALLALIFFFLGGAPFWIYNLQYPLATFKFLLGGERSNTVVNSLRVIRHAATDLAPRLVSGDPTWALLSRPATWLLVAIYGTGIAILLLERRRKDSGLLSLFIVCFLPIYILSGFGSNALNPFHLDATGRYVLMIHSILPIGLALLARVRRVGIALVVAALALNLTGMARIDPTPVFTSPYYTMQPPTLQPLIDLLDARKISHVWTDVGIAQVLMFDTHERILAADYYDRYYANGLVRFPEVFDKVQAAPDIAYVEMIQSGQTDTPIDRAFHAAGVEYERLTPTDRLLVIIPRTKIDPARVLSGLGFQY